MDMLNHNLHIFLNVAEEASITEAANKLFISQPAVSKAVKLLEDELNLKLFHRDKRRGLILTDVGREILLLARQMADMENRIYQKAFRYNSFIGGKVKVASMPILTSVILAPTLYEYRTKYPHVAIEITEGSSMEIRKAVEEHEADFAVTSAPFGGLDYEILMEDRMIAVSREPLSDTCVDINENAERLIFCKAGHETVMETLKAYKIDISQSFIVQQAETVLRLANFKNGIGVLSELVTQNTPNNLLRYTVKPEVRIEIGIAANNLNDLTPAAAELKRMITETVKLRDIKI